MTAYQIQIAARLVQGIQTNLGTYKGFEDGFHVFINAKGQFHNVGPKALHIVQFR